MSGQIQTVVTPTGPLAVIRPVAERLLKEGVISGALDGGLHAADAATVKAAIMAGDTCDFCSGPGATNDFDVPDFEISPGLRSTGGWAACDACAELIRADKRKALLDRSLGAAAFPKFSRSSLAELHGKFWQGMDDKVEAAAAAAAFADFIEDREKTIRTNLPQSKRDVRVAMIARITGLSVGQVESITGGNIGRDVVERLVAFQRRAKIGTKDERSFIEMLAGDDQRKPLAPIVPHWQRALDMKFAALDRTAKLARDGVPAQFFSPGETDLNDQASLRRILADSEAARQTYVAQNRADAKALAHAEAYSFNAETAGAIAAAAPGYDALDPPASSVDTPGGGRAGWFWFAEPLATRTAEDTDGTSALLWYWDESDGTPELRFSAFGVDRTDGSIVPAAYWRWPLAQTFHGLLADVVQAYDDGLVLVANDRPFGRDATLKGIAELTLFFVAACVWMKSRILVPSAGHIERHERKRIQRARKLADPPAVQVIALRRSARAETGVEAGKGEGAAGHKMTVRFIVSGHPRLQRCGPGRKDVKLIWIAPFTKGPEGAPLRIRKRVFAVVR